MWLWKVVPQDASGDLALTTSWALTPINSKLCNWCSVVCLALALTTHLFYGYAEAVPAIEDPGLSFMLQFTATLALGGLIYEACLALAIKAMSLHSRYQSDLAFRRRLRLNRKMMVVFAVLSSLYQCMASDRQWVHKGWLAERYGGYQVVYSLRYVEWVCCAPIVLSVSGQLEHAQDGTPRNGLIPSSLLTGIYCLIAWQGLVVTDGLMAHVLIGWAFVCYFVASAEQIAFASYIKDQGSAGPLRAGLIYYLVAMMGVYGLVYLLPIPGWMSASTEQKFYCLGDISFKLGTSIMLIASNDMAANEEARMRAMMTAEDLQRLIHTASVPIVGVDCDCRVNEWNMKAASLTGLPKAKAIGRPLLSMIGKASRDEADKVIQAALRGEENGAVETTLYTHAADSNDGDQNSQAQKAVLMLSASPRKDKMGTVQGVTLVGCDLTEIAACKEAEVRKIQFMAVVSHELRSPLHGIIGLTDHLIQDEARPERQRLMQLVKNCSTRLLDLVVNIMEMASMVSKDAKGKPPPKALSRDPVQLAKIIEEITVLVRSSVDKAGMPMLKKSVELRNEVRDLPIIEADAYRCTQVFHNIITNACKFTEKGHITVSSRKDPEERYVEVMVTDTGKGIARPALERIFQPFEQEDNSMMRGYQGIGLGLSIAQEVVARHSGHIYVDSELGVGTTFTVRLPTVMPDIIPDVAPASAKVRPDPPAEPEDVASEPEEVAAAEPEEDSASEPQEVAASEPENAPERAPEQMLTLLSVDDDCLNQELIRRSLSNTFTIHTAMDGYEALRFLKHCRVLPDLVLLDVMMPGMSGFEVCRAIREEVKIPASKLPIIMLSAATASSSIIEGFESGCTDYITKPFQKDVLCARLKGAWSARQGPDRDEIARKRQTVPLHKGSSATLSRSQSFNGEPEPVRRRSVTCKSWE